MRVKNYKVRTRKTKKPQNNFWKRYKAKREREWKSEWYKQLRKSIFERDAYTCAITGKVGGKLHLHHIKRYYDYPALRFDPRNLITLSAEAHDKITGNEKCYEKKLWAIAQAREKERKNAKSRGQVTVKRATRHSKAGRKRKR